MSQEESLSVERLLKKLNSSEFQKHMLVLGFFLLKVIFFLKRAFLRRVHNTSVTCVCMAFGLERLADIELGSRKIVIPFPDPSIFL